MRRSEGGEGRRALIGRELEHTTARWGRHTLQGKQALVFYTEVVVGGGNGHPSVSLIQRPPTPAHVRTGRARARTHALCHRRAQGGGWRRAGEESYSFALALALALNSPSWRLPSARTHPAAKSNKQRPTRTVAHHCTVHRAHARTYVSVYIWCACIHGIHTCMHVLVPYARAPRAHRPVPVAFRPQQLPYNFVCCACVRINNIIYTNKYHMYTCDSRSPPRKTALVAPATVLTPPEGGNKWGGVHNSPHIVLYFTVLYCALVQYHRETSSIWSEPSHSSDKLYVQLELLQVLLSARRTTLPTVLCPGSKPLQHHFTKLHPEQPRKRSTVLYCTVLLLPRCVCVRHSTGFSPTL